MSNSSGGSSGIQRRIESVNKRGRLSRHVSTAQKPIVTTYDAYTYALRTAYLSHLLQPKARRLQYAPAAPRPAVQRQSTTVADLVKDFSTVRDSKSTRLPHAFMGELDRRITGVLMGTERMPEFGDALVKRSFAAFLNELKKPEFRRSMEKDRRAEDLLLIFFSNATKELQKGKAPNDDSWRLMVDRHVALFVRLVSSTLKSNDWTKDKPDLVARLQTLEDKLLRHDQDLSAPPTSNGGSGGAQVEVEVPRSQQVKDMPLVVIVAEVFGKSLPQAQSDINDQKDLWTEKSALQDLKMYQTNLSLNNRKTLRGDDFDTDEAYDAWKRSEAQDLSQLMLTIVQSNRGLANSAPVTIEPAQSPDGSRNGVDYAELSRRLSGPNAGTYAFDQPVDMRSLSIDATNVAGQNHDDGEQYMFIPPDPRAYYRVVLQEALLRDLPGETAANNSDTSHEDTLLPKPVSDLLSDLGSRWRLPLPSRLVLLLDVVRERFMERIINLDTLDAAFTYFKQPPVDKKKQVDLALLFDRTKWPIKDYVLNQQVLASIHDTLLRDLFEQFEHCYDTKPPEIGPAMTILETHIYDDPLFSKTPEDLDRFSDHLHEALQTKASEHYNALFVREISQLGNRVEFFHIIQLGKAVIKFLEKIQKRYRKLPQIMGVEPYAILVDVVLPAFVADIRNQTSSILENEKGQGGEISVQDGFELYKELVELRHLHAEALPDVQFGFDVEEMLQTFVWRWIASLDEKIIGWVDAAVKQDTFQASMEASGQQNGTNNRHSVSVLDIFQSFNDSIEQVLKLNWDNDLQYAKFMTALSKAVGAGLSRYCDQLEQLFIKEMDRLTPEQEAVSQQTTQEKWIRLAKEAIVTKEKTEPFQFLPESLVKLNNVEYAMLLLDKLQKEMNADACAEVIKKHEKPLQPRQRKDETFLFTVKVIEAEDLKACDMNGLSDPYVVLVDEAQKRLAKTRIVYGNLNPRWDETVDIMTKGSVNVIATIWDWDAMGDHDCVGRTAIKLDPSHFKDFLPREYWLDLDTQGRLLVRVSMEGEKDDIQFYFGKTFRALKRTERDMTRKITDKLSAYIQYCLSRRTLKSLTSTGMTISSVSSYFQRNRPQPAAQGPTSADIENAIKPLFAYFNENFAIMNQTLTSDGMVTVMARLWKETLSTIESLLVPPMSDKLSAQRQLSSLELSIVFKWLKMLFDFFHAVDEQSGESEGVPLEILKSPKYQDIQNLNFFYYDPTEDLIRTSERMVIATAERQQQAQIQARNSNRASAPALMLPNQSFGGAAGLRGFASTRRSKSIMLSRNLGTMKKAKEEKRREAQTEPSDDMILRILRMRPEAERYLRDRARQKEKLAAVAAAEQIVRQSLGTAAARETLRPFGGVDNYLRGLR